MRYDRPPLTVAQINAALRRVDRTIEHAEALRTEFATGGRPLPDWLIERERKARQERATLLLDLERIRALTPGL